MLPRHIKSLEVLKYVPHIPIGTETSDSCGGHTSASTMNKGSPETEASMFEVLTIANERNCIIQANWTQRLVTENLALFCKNSNRPVFFKKLLFHGVEDSTCPVTCVKLLRSYVEVCSSAPAQSLLNCGVS